MIASVLNRDVLARTSLHSWRRFLAQVIEMIEESDRRDVQSVATILSTKDARLFQPIELLYEARNPSKTRSFLDVDRNLKPRLFLSDRNR